MEKTRTEIAGRATGDHELSRREFTVDSLLALFAGVTITVSATACGSSGSSGPATPDGSRSGNIEANHAHVATISGAEIIAGNAVILNIRGSSDHPHTVSLTGAEVVQIGNGTQVIKTSSTDPSAAFGTHAHTVTFN